MTTMDSVLTLDAKLVGVEPITTVIRSGRLRWYGHVMKKSDDGWVKKCMEFKVGGRRPVGRPRRSWLESVEADMAEFEIDRDVHDRRNIMKRKTHLIGKQAINDKTMQIIKYLIVFI